MTQEHFFGGAKWVGAEGRTKTSFTVLRGHFTARAGDTAMLNVLGLGFFKCYINGILINPDTFLPLSSDFEASADPNAEVLSGHRVYVPRFDVSPYLRDGDNVIALHFGGGWYAFRLRTFGLPKAIYRITVEGGGETVHYFSGESCKVRSSFVTGYDLTTHENHSYVDFTDCFGADLDDASWQNAVLTEPLNTEYCETDCPADGLIETLTPKAVGMGANGGTVYDAGENTVGYPVLHLSGNTGDTVTVLFSEEVLLSGSLDPTHMHKQKFVVTDDGKGRTVQPEFTWFGFRFFEVIGAAEPTYVKVVHATVPISSTFDSDNETLNWMYKTFIHTMRCNMHTGHPSDCPHIERRGYTGDGQLTCHAALSVLGGKAFYEKWLQDIADGQDTLSGHIQYTAPYIRSGGGPGGWGCAIVEVPWQLYRHYGDEKILEKYYPNMRRYIDYLEAHAEFGLVTSDQPGAWCLGDWCGPNILYPDKDITYASQQILIPAPMVNTYFMAKSLLQMAKIARIIGRPEDVAELEEKAKTCKNAIRAAYLNTFDGNFAMNAQGANAYAVDLGIGNPKTYPSMVNYYKKLGHYDTGIFATDILTRVLFENGDADLAVDLLTNNGEQGFEHWRQNGATTFHEYWDSSRSRSHSHPMFGAPVAYLFEHLLGIGQAPHTAGYTSLIIEPKAVSRFGRMSGSMKVPNGTVAVSYEKKDDGVRFTISIPPCTKAVFRYADAEYPLCEGKNVFTGL